jgi:hypothetical protein
MRDWGDVREPDESQHPAPRGEIESCRRSPRAENSEKNSYIPLLSLLGVQNSAAAKLGVVFPADHLVTVTVTPLPSSCTIYTCGHSLDYESTAPTHDQPNHIGPQRPNALMIAVDVKEKLLGPAEKAMAPGSAPPPGPVWTGISLSADHEKLLKSERRVDAQRNPQSCNRAPNACGEARS